MKHVLLTGALAAAPLFWLVPALAAGTESFDMATPSNSAYSNGVIPGTALEVVAGYAWIATDSAPGRGNFLDLASGWYSPNFDNAANLGTSTVRSVETFDLIAGYQYTMSFEYSRQAFSAGNGPFDTSLIASLGSHSVTYNEVAGFYYGLDWKAGTLSFTQQTTELGAHVMFTAAGPAGYSGMDVDTISMVAAAPVPEPTTWVLMLAGLAGLTYRSTRRNPPTR
ncbi:hypothetical protein BH11PSE9_BH11PSE9_12270 [soil metagenome]